MKTRSGPYNGLEEGAELERGGQNDETPDSLSGTAQPEVCTAATGAAARSCAETAVPDNTIGEEQVFTVQSSNHRKGVRSLYIRHKGIQGDGVAMARELSGKFAIGNGRGEISQVDELKLMASKLHPFWAPIPDAEPGEEEYVVDPKDKISTKAAI